jgi:hypothetical protein
MGRIVVTEFLSLDGVVEDPGGGDFRHGGWTLEFVSGEEGQQFKFGRTRRTSESWRPLWSGEPARLERRT